jgi:hypothetical protein
MIRVHYFPDWSGDWRLEAVDADNCTLTVVSPTPAEIANLGAFLKKARSKNWVEQHIGFIPNGEVKLAIKAPLVKAGKVLLGKRTKGTLTAVVSEKGEVRAVTDGDADKVEKEASKQDAKAAATVGRPTLCCPLCETGPDKLANEVLLEFCAPWQACEWEREGVLHCYGNLSGRKYEIVHRHHPLAEQRGKIVWDCEGGYVMHGYAWDRPPAEEALTMKLVLEHAEHWIRNASGCKHHDGPIYENPFVDEDEQYSDGVLDASMMSSLGASLAMMVPPEKKP